MENQVRFKPPAVVCVYWLGQGEPYILKKEPVFDIAIEPVMNVILTDGKSAVFNRVNCTFMEPINKEYGYEELHDRIKCTTDYLSTLFLSQINKTLLALMCLTYEDAKKLKNNHSDIIKIIKDGDRYEINISLNHNNKKLYTNYMQEHMKEE